MRYASPIPLLALFRYLEERGVAPEEVAESSVVAMVRRRAGGHVPASLIVDILERCAVRLDDPLFGLRYGQQVDVKSYGPLSLLWRYAPTLRYGNRVANRILHLQHEGLNVAVRQDGDTTGLHYLIDAEPGRQYRQFIEAGVSLMLQVCRLIMSKTWTPLSVGFAHEQVGAIADYAAIVNAPVKFGAPENGIDLRSTDFDRPSPEHNAEILAFVEHSLLRLSEQHPLPFRQRLDQVVDDLIAIHKPHLTAAAAMMAMSSRTLQRHLAAEGISFREVVDDRRRMIIETWQQRAIKPSLSLLAERTAFSEASAVSRFMRRSAAQRNCPATG
jgi:AraC-like DNA-binding protein